VGVVRAIVYMVSVWKVSLYFIYTYSSDSSRRCGYCLLLYLCGLVLYC